MSVPHGLNRRQIAWLKLHATYPAPVRWAWLTADGRRLHGKLDDAMLLRAWRQPGPGGDRRQATIHKDDRDGLVPYFNSGLFTVNEVGLALLRELA